jgi:2-octaprenyl-6-methoxyphenol hydroxylase
MTVLRSTSIPPSPTTQSLDADVIIVGGGIVGATLACALAPSGLRITIVEAKPQSQGLANRRAYALSITSAQLFDNLGLWSQIQPRITSCPTIRLSDGQYPSILWFTPQDLADRVSPGRDHPSVVHVGEHGVILDVLYRRLATHPNVQWCCPQTVESVEYLADRAIVHLTSPDPRSPIPDLRSPGGRMPFALTSRLLIAADGHQSPLRQAAGIAYRGWPYWQSCIGFTVKTELDHQNIAYERFWPSGPFAILPLPDRRAQVVWTAPHGEAQALAALPDSEFLVELNQRFGDQMGQIQLDTPRTVFPVQLRQSQQYSRHRLALVGDAAHSCHPVGGQGLNMGIRDAIALAQVIRRAQDRGQDIGQVRILGRYQRWRQLENLAILGFTDVLDRVFSSQWLPIVWVRRLGLQLLIRVPIARRLALGLMTGRLGWLPRLDSTGR